MSERDFSRLRDAAAADHAGIREGWKGKREVLVKGGWDFFSRQVTHSFAMIGVARESSRPERNWRNP